MATSKWEIVPLTELRDAKGDERRTFSYFKINRYHPVIIENRENEKSEHETSTAESTLRDSAFE